MYMIGLTVNIQNFHTRHTGVVSGIVHSARSLVLGVLLGMYDMLHMDILPSYPVTPKPTSVPSPTMSRDVINAKLEILRNFFTFLLLGYSIVNVLAVLVYGDYRSVENEVKDDGTSQELQPIRRAHSVTSAVSGYSSTTDTRQLVPETDEDQPGSLTQLLTNRTFHYFLWPSVTLLALRNVFLTNLSVFLASFQVTYLRRVVYLIPMGGLLLKPIIGVLADIAEKKIPRSFFCLVSTVVLMIFYLVDMGFVELFPILVVTMFLSLATEACIQALGPGIHNNLFGPQSFPSGWGLITLIMTLFTLLFQVLLGIVYDLFVPIGQITCYGFHCYMIYFFICALVTYACVVCLFFLGRTEWEKLKN